MDVPSAKLPRNTGELMQLTRAADYAVRAMIHFATLPPERRITRDALADATGVPQSFLGKVLQSLVRAGFVVSRRGQEGGFALGVDSTKVSIVEVIEAVEGPIALNLCLMSGESCNEQAWCGAHRVWMRAQQAMLGVLRSASIADIAAQTVSYKEGLAYGGATKRSDPC